MSGCKTYPSPTFPPDALLKCFHWSWGPDELGPVQPKLRQLQRRLPILVGQVAVGSWQQASNRQRGGPLTKGVVARLKKLLYTQAGQLRPPAAMPASLGAFPQAPIWWWWWWWWWCFFFFFFLGGGAPCLPANPV
jgi:hypothetical protein